MVPRRRDADDAQAGQPRELDRCEADGAGGAPDDDCALVALVVVAGGGEGRERQVEVLVLVQGGGGGGEGEGQDGG